MPSILLSNLIVTQQKFVLILDEIGWENNSEKIISKILQEQNEARIIRDLLPCNGSSLTGQKSNIPENLLSRLEDKSVVVLPPAEKLFQEYFASDVFKFVHKLKSHSKVKQIFIWLTTKNFNQNDFLPTFLGHMSDILVTFLSKSELEILTRKVGGTVTKKLYNFEAKDSIYVDEVKKKHKEVKVEEPKIKPETLGTFKIELSEKDLIARNTLVLPFEKHLKIGEVPSQGGGNIIYHPDKDDDFDEEDPDDDLDI